MAARAYYRLPDEPLPSGLSRYATDPLWPLLTLMLAGGGFGRALLDLRFDAAAAEPADLALARAEQGQRAGAHIGGALGFQHQRQGRRIAARGGRGAGLDDRAHTAGRAARQGAGFRRIGHGRLPWAGWGRV